MDLQGLSKLTDNGIRKLVEIPNLRVLELSGCTGLTSAGVESLRVKAKQLEVLIWSEPTTVQPEKKDKIRGLFLKRGRTKVKEKSKNRGAEHAKSPERSTKSGKTFLQSMKFKKNSEKKPAQKKGPGHKKSKSVDILSHAGDFPTGFIDAITSHNPPNTQQHDHHPDLNVNATPNQNSENSQNQNLLSSSEKSSNVKDGGKEQGGNQGNNPSSASGMTQSAINEANNASKQQGQGQQGQGGGGGGGTGIPPPLSINQKIEKTVIDKLTSPRRKKEKNKEKKTKENKKNDKKSKKKEGNLDLTGSGINPAIININNSVSTSSSKDSITRSDRHTKRRTKTDKNEDEKIFDKKMEVMARNDSEKSPAEQRKKTKLEIKIIKKKEANDIKIERINPQDPPPSLKFPSSATDTPKSPISPNSKINFPESAGTVPIPNTPSTPSAPSTPGTSEIKLAPSTEFPNNNPQTPGKLESKSLDQSKYPNFNDFSKEGGKPVPKSSQGSLNEESKASLSNSTGSNNSNSGNNKDKSSFNDLANRLETSSGGKSKGSQIANELPKNQYNPASKDDKKESIPQSPVKMVKKNKQTGVTTSDPSIPNPSATKSQGSMVKRTITSEKTPTSPATATKTDEPSSDNDGKRGSTLVLSRKNFFDHVYASESDIKPEIIKKPTIPPVTKPTASTGGKGSTKKAYRTAAGDVNNKNEAKQQIDTSTVATRPRGSTIATTPTQLSNLEQFEQRVSAIKATFESQKDQKSKANLLSVPNKETVKSKRSSLVLARKAVFEETAYIPSIAIPPSPTPPAKKVEEIIPPTTPTAPTPSFPKRASSNDSVELQSRHQIETPPDLPEIITENNKTATGAQLSVQAIASRWNKT